MATVDFTNYSKYGSDPSRAERRWLETIATWDAGWLAEKPPPPKERAEARQLLGPRLVDRMCAGDPTLVPFMTIGRWRGLSLAGRRWLSMCIFEAAGRVAD